MGAACLADWQPREARLNTSNNRPKGVQPPVVTIPLLHGLVKHSATKLLSLGCGAHFTAYRRPVSCRRARHPGFCPSSLSSSLFCLGISQLSTCTGPLGPS